MAYPGELGESYKGMSSINISKTTDKISKSFITKKGVFTEQNPGSALVIDIEWGSIKR